MEDFNCPVCCDIFNDPVILTCTHSFCKACLQRYWDTIGSRRCPICRKMSTQTELVTNLILKNLCESFLKERSSRAEQSEQLMCSLHGEKLKLFCIEDQEPVCVVCRDAKMHSNHRCHPIGDVIGDFKEVVENKLQPLMRKLTVFEDFKSAYNQTLKYIMTQAKDTERHIKEEFGKFHRILWDEEAARIAGLRREEKQKTDMMKQKIEKICKEISSLSGVIEATENAIGADDITFLKNFKSTVTRACCNLQEPEMVAGALIDVAKHRGNLKFNVWKNLQFVAENVPVILDHNTAHQNLIVSEDLTGVRYSGQGQQLPDNPERFDEYPSVLGSEGFSSGTHSWDVEVGDSPSWEVGVMLESAKVKGIDDNENLTGRWVLIHAGNEYKAYSGDVSLKRVIKGEPVKPLKVKEKPKRIHVEVSLDKGRISFSDPDSNTQLETFTHKFWLWNEHEKVFPYFKATSSLRILPVETIVIEG